MSMFLVALVVLLQSSPASTDCTALFGSLNVSSFEIPRKAIPSNFQETDDLIVFHFPERVAPRLGFDLKKTADNWPKLACGQTVREVDQLIGLGVSNLAARSGLKLVVVQLGRYQTAFRKDQLVSWRVLN